MLIDVARASWEKAQGTSCSLEQYHKKKIAFEVRVFIII